MTAEHPAVTYARLHGGRPIVVIATAHNRDRTTHAVCDGQTTYCGLAVHVGRHTISDGLPGWITCQRCYRAYVKATGYQP